MVMVQTLYRVFGGFTSKRRAQTSMIGASSCCHLSLLILLLLLLLLPRLAFANINSAAISSSSSPSSAWSSTISPSPSLKQPSSPTSASSPSSTASTTPASTTTASGPQTEAPPISSISHSETPLISNSQTGDDGLSTPSGHAEGSNQSPHVMQTTPSNPSNLEPSSQTTPSNSSNLEQLSSQTTPSKHLTITKRAKFKPRGTEREKKILSAVENIFLKNAGLQTRPRITSEFAVPEYMLDLYKSQVQCKNKYLQVKGNGAIAANTVRSFVHTDTPSDTCQSPLCSRVHFDVSSIPEHDNITGAELRIFADARNDEVSPGARELHRIEVYEIIRPASRGDDVISRLLDTRAVKEGNSTWETFDIQPAVLKWKRGHAYNHGLEIRLVSRAPSLSIDNHIRLRKAVHLPNSEWALQRPLLVTYTIDESSPSTSSSSSSSWSPKNATRLRRKRRSAEDEEDTADKKKRRRKEGRKNKKRGGKKKKNRRNKKGNKNICQKHSMYVNFQEVGWDDWIVAPLGYQAYYCNGDCLAPLPDYTRASGHAMLQARVYHTNNTLVPMVCCVPVKMSAISMLYRNEKGTTVLKTYNDMVVDECGCQ